MHDILPRVCNKQETAGPVDAVAPEWFGGGHERRIAELKVVVFICTVLCKCIAYAALSRSGTDNNSCSFANQNVVSNVDGCAMHIVQTTQGVMPIAMIRGQLGCTLDMNAAITWENDKARSESRGGYE